MNRKKGVSTEVTVGGNDRSPGSELLRREVSIYLFIYRDRERV